jgi:hypothetical protein
MMLPTLACHTPLPMSDRRQRIHSLVLALLAHQSDLELLEDDRAGAVSSPLGGGGDPGSWLERNRRTVQRYQSLVRSAVTLDALIEQELGADQLGGGSTSG